MLKQVRKEDIPEWDFGDVTIKTFSFGEKLELGNLKAKMTKEGPELSDGEVSIKDITIKALAAGIHFVRTSDNSQFIILANSQLSDKEKKVYDFSFESGQYLLKLIYELNKPLEKEDIKN